MQAQHTTPLPDPFDQPNFYDGVAVKRLLAWIIDSVLIAVLVFLALFFTAGLGLLFFGFLYLAIGFAYRALTLSQSAATPGMQMMAIEFRAHDGLRIGSDTAVLHTLGFTVSMAMPLLQIISVVLMLTNGRGQGLTDLLLGTVALNKRR